MLQVYKQVAACAIQPARNVSGKVVANTCPCISAVASADFAMARCSMIDMSLFATAVAIAIVDR